MSPGLALYRGLTWALGFLLPPLASLGSRDSAWRGALEGASVEGARAAGSIWIHAASMGEVGAARRWVDALLESGMRPPLLLTTRTRTGLARALREMPGRVAVRFAPLDLPQLVRGLLEAACPSRLDIVETEVWPNLILEARRAGVAVLFVSATISERTARRLRALGAGGKPLFGDGVFALAQDESAAVRFVALGIPPARVRVAGDLKADEAGPFSEIPEAERRAVIYGSFRPGEEEAALAIARALEGIGEGDDRGHPLLVVAPRHPEGSARAHEAFQRSGYSIFERKEIDRGKAIRAWLDETAALPGRRIGLLSTHGELAALYDFARAAVVGGTFAPFGGHTPWEAAERGCPVVIGPSYEEIGAGADQLVREGGGAVVADAAHAARTIEAWWKDGSFPPRSEGARRATRAGAGAARRGLAIIAEWGLVP